MSELRNKKKVLIFTPGALGGAERMCIKIGQLLDKDKFDVQYVIWGRLKQIYQIIPEGSNVDVIPFRNVYCFSILRVWWKIIRSKPDIVFSSLSIFNPRVIIAAKLARTKMIIRSSGMVSDYGWWKYTKLKLTYPFANILVAQQEDMRKEMASKMKLPQNKIVTIYNPIDTADIDNKKGAPTPFTKPNTINYVNVARVNWNKGQDVAIKAFSKVREKLENAHLWIVGYFEQNDSYYQELVSLVKSLKLESYVHFTGHDDNPFKWVSHSDCFVFPSRHEGLPNALVEASYIGVPCATSDCLNVVKEIIKDGYNGYITGVDDVEGLANAMIKTVSLKDFQMIYKPGTAQDFNDLFDRTL